MQDVARVDQAYAGAPGNRRAQRGVVQLGAGVGNDRLVGRDLRFQLRHQRALRGHGLLAGQFLRRQLGIALQVQPGVGQLGLVLALGRHRLVQRGLVGARIDLRQHVAGLDVLAFGKAQLDQLAIDARADGGGVEGLHRAQATEVNRQLAALDHRGLHAHGIGRGGGGAGRFGFVRLVRGRVHRQPQQQQGTQRRQQHPGAADLPRPARAFISDHDLSTLFCQPPPSAPYRFTSA